MEASLTTDALVLRAKRLQSMPLTLQSFLSGSLSSSRVDLLCRANLPRISAEFTRDEEMLVESAKELPFIDAAQVVKYWKQLADEDHEEDRAKRQHEQRSASVSKGFEGSVDLRALLDPVNGEIFSVELERLEKLLEVADG